MDRAEAIKAMKSLQDNLGVDRSEENLTTEAATHDKRTETHECVSETHGDIISREAAREAIEKLMEIHFDRQVVLAKARDAIVSLPSAVCNDCIWTVCNYNKVDWDAPSTDTDMSDYSDRLWKAAYERGKADGLGKLKNPCDSLLTDDPDERKEHKSKLDCISRQKAIGAVRLATVWKRSLGRGDILDILYSIPPVTPTERTGEWKKAVIEKLESLMKDMENEIEDAKKHPENYTKNFIIGMEHQVAGVAHATHEIIDMPSA